MRAESYIYEVGLEVRLIYREFALVRGVVTEYPPPWSCLWPDRDAGPWRVTLHYSLRGSDVVVVGVDITAVDRDTCPPLDGARLRKLSIAQLAQESGANRIEAALREIADFSQPEYAEFGGPSPQAKEAVRIYDRAGQQRGRPPLYSKDHWQKVARAYQLHSDANRPDPVARVAEQFGVSRSTAKNWITRARDKGELPPANGNQPPRGQAKEKT